MRGREAREARLAPFGSILEEGCARATQPLHRLIGDDRRRIETGRRGGALLPRIDAQALPRRMTMALPPGKRIVAQTVDAASAFTTAGSRTRFERMRPSNIRSNGRTLRPTKDRSLKIDTSTLEYPFQWQDIATVPSMHPRPGERRHEKPASPLALKDGGLRRVLYGHLRTLAICVDMRPWTCR